MPVRTRLRRSNRSVELMRVAALETRQQLAGPTGESAEPSGPWKPWVDFATEISAPAGRTAQPAGVTRSLRAAAALAGSAARPTASRRRDTAREITTFDAVGRTEATRPLSSPRMRARLRFLPALGTVVGVAVLLKIVYAPWFLNYDARYALVWARDLARGLTPDYEAPFAPTPHPLETLVSLVAVPFGTGGDAIMLWATLLAFGALVWLAYRLGAELFSPAVGVVTALVVLTRPALERDALIGYQDTAFALVIVWAVLLEARQARRGVPVLLLLALAGLMRPEAWALAGLYTLYLWRGATRPRAARLRRADRARPGAVVARGPGGDRRRAALAARHRRPRRDRRPPPRPAHRPVLGGEVPRLRAARAAGDRGPDRPRVRVAARAGARVAPVPDRGGDARRLPRRPAVRAAADRPLRPRPRGAAGGLLRARGDGLADAAAHGQRRGWAIAGAVAALLSVAYLPWHVKLLHGVENRIDLPGRLLPRPALRGRGEGGPRRVRAAAGRSPPPTTARSRTCAGGSRATPAASRRWARRRRAARACSSSPAARAR